MSNEANAIWNNFDKELHQFICSKVNHNDECHDILQNVYLKVLNNIARIQQVNNIPSYLYRIASNEVIDHYRNSSKYEQVELLEIEPEQEEIKDRALQLADCCLRPMIEALPAIYRDALNFPCCTSVTMGMIGGKWKSVILYYLIDGSMRYNELQKRMNSLTERTLSLLLKNLEQDGVIQKKIFNSKPPLRVEYTLTDFGKTLIPLLKSISDWGGYVVENYAEVE